MRILVVEDNKGIGELVCDDLREQGYAIDWARDGDEALELLASFPYDLVVLDLMLPGHNGFEIVDRLRYGGKKVPVLMLAARDGVEDRVRGSSSVPTTIWLNRFISRKCELGFGRSCGVRKVKPAIKSRSGGWHSTSLKNAPGLSEPKFGYRAGNIPCSSFSRLTPEVTTPGTACSSTSGPATPASIRAQSIPISAIYGAS